MTFDFRKFLREFPDSPEATVLAGAVREAAARGEELHQQLAVLAEPAGRALRQIQEGCAALCESLRQLPRGEELRQQLAVLAESAGQALPQIQEGWAALSESFRLLPRGEELRQPLAALAESAGQALPQIQEGWAALSESFRQLRSEGAAAFERLRQALDDPGTVELVMNVFILVLHAELQPELALNEAESQRFNEDTRELFRELEKRKLYWLARDDLPFPERRRRYLDDLRLVRRAARLGALAFVNEVQRRIAREAECARAATARVALAEHSVIIGAAVQEHAEALWARKPGLRNKLRQTALEIENAVNGSLKNAGLKPVTVEAVRQRVAKLV